jgi:hypothetical protein
MQALSGKLFEVMSRITRKLIALLGIAAVLFAQLAVSAYACPLQDMESDDVVAVAGTASDSRDLRDTDSPALCQKHCENGKQNINDTPQPPLIVSLSPTFTVTVVNAGPASLAAASPIPSLLRATSPPLSICNCCFRI